MPFPSIGPGELILILIIALVVLGPGKLPDVAQSLGKSVREFRKAATDVTEAGKLDGPGPSQAAQISPDAAPVAPPPAAPAAPASAAIPAAPPHAGVDAPPAPAGDAARSPDAAPNAGEPARDPNLS
jgi:TatA/E family protein of Tat protein translocase